MVPNGVFERDVQGVEASSELDGGFSVLCVSGLRREKRVDLFIEAVAAARRDNPEIRGYVAGDGPEREQLERLADGNGVTLLGVRRDVLDLIRAADALCLPSEAEALPMSILEAMALERPVVATDVGGIAEQVVDGETGHLVPAGYPEPIRHALLALAADPERARAMGAAGRRRQRERFDGEAMVDGYVRVFEEAVAVARPDVLLVSLGTTLGWRVADEMLLEQLRRAGASTAVVSVGRGAADRLRRGYPLNDLVEMHAARRTVETAVERHEPRALIVSSTTAAMLPPLPAGPLRGPLRLARAAEPAGHAQRVLHALERRGMSRARITIPFSVAGARGAAGGGRAGDRRLATDRSIRIARQRRTRRARSGWPWRTCPTPRRRASTCWWPAGRPPPCRMRGSRSTGSTRSGRARTSGEAACPSRRAST